ncbi:MAG: nucleotidyltransferase domain-containing protein [Spirochaetales bacterium]|nr:nucleotidyltransferase domain-containing protein [Spirochaetales bacterium]
MKKQGNDNQDLLQSLNERAKELQCLYKVKEIVNKDQQKIKEVLPKLIEIIPMGWQYPENCCVRIIYQNDVFASDNFTESKWVQKAELKLKGELVGSLEVFFIDRDNHLHTPFLAEEQQLLNSIAERIENYLFQRDIQISLDQWEQARKDINSNVKADWMVILELVEKMDSNLFNRICRRMLNRLCFLGIAEAQSILGCLGMKKSCDNIMIPQDVNIPSLKIDFSIHDKFYQHIFKIASRNLGDDELLAYLNKWIKEDKIGFLVQVLENTDTPLSEISAAVSKYHHLNNSHFEISSYSRCNINSLFIQRLFTDQIEFIKFSRDYLDIDDFYSILQHSVYPNNSHGKLGGKSAGLFIAEQFLKNAGIEVMTPSTWYISSDFMLKFIYYNNLEEALEQKFKDIEEVRADYPNFIQVFKNSNFPIDLLNGLSMVVDNLGDKPIIIRSSSLLEDRYGTAFSGKYKSLFLANQGTKEERLKAVLDAVAEVYASTIGPDPIEYRKEHGLLEFHEEMAIIIQEVVGEKVGKYFFPSFAGVGFSQNEYRWSPRINKEDGLLRIVPGLGTRAVDRLSNDYPVLLCPGNPDIKVNPDPLEAARYSPKMMDVINLETNTFESVDLINILRTYGSQYPDIVNLISVFSDNCLFTKNIYQLDFENDDLIFSLEPLIQNTDFIFRIKQMLHELKDKMHTEVDIEFAYCRGEIYLLQCRPQAGSLDSIPQPIPKDISENSILFNAKKHVSNGIIDNITNIVYVNPDAYSSLNTLEKLERVGRAISRINSLLPKRRFILMGPGRWGSRGDIKLGVKVNYSDINNTAMLIEIAQKKGDYLPELSFGTHFFQDLVESSIKYLPLYPDDSDIIFNKTFLSGSGNILSELIPEYSDLSDVIYVADVMKEREGKILRILMNEDINEALAYFATPSSQESSASVDIYSHHTDKQEDYWSWRFAMAEKIADSIDVEKFGVKAFYLFGSTKNANAGPMSDIDLLIHVDDSCEKKKSLLLWLDGWSLCLGRINYLRTGYKTDNLLDVHLITDSDIEKRTSFAVKIDAVTDSARELPLRHKSD